MLIFVDIETTGVEFADKICSIAVLDEGNFKYELVNEGKKIPPQVSSIHHITNEMIKDKVAFKESEVYHYVVQNNNNENILVSHNLQFDLKKLAAAGIVWQGETIDTNRVTKHLVPECELFSLQVLRYELRLYKQENEIKQKYGIKDALFAHNALSDVLFVKLLFDYLSEMASVDKMKELSLKNVLIEKFTFGKHNGKYIEEVAQSDRSYLEWMLTSVPEIQEDIKYSINYYLQGQL